MQIEKRLQRFACKCLIVKWAHQDMILGPPDYALVGPPIYYKGFHSFGGLCNYYAFLAKCNNQAD